MNLLCKVFGHRLYFDSCDILCGSTCKRCGYKEPPYKPTWTRMPEVKPAKKKMKPKSSAKLETEAAHQAALFAWASLQISRWPELRWLHHIPNGGSRGDGAKSRAIRGAQLKAQGVRAGVADVCLPVRRGDYSGLYIEMKRPKEKPVKATSKGGVSDEQAEFGAFVQSQGFIWRVCYSWEDAASIIEQYLEPYGRDDSISVKIHGAKI